MFRYVLDIGIVGASYYITALIRFGGSIPESNYTAIVGSLPYLLLITIPTFWAFGMYDRFYGSYLSIAGSTALSVIALNVEAMAIAYFVRLFAFPRSVFFVGGVVAGVLLFLLRLVFRLSGNQDNPVLITLGSDDRVVIQKDSNDSPVPSRSAYRILPNGPIWIDASLPERERAKIIEECLQNKQKLFIAPKVTDILINQAELVRFGDMPMLEMVNLTISSIEALVKRLIDIILSSFALVLFLPVFVCISILIRIDSPGPIFYTQERVGLAKKSFEVIKFRTMVPNAEELSGPVLASEHDERITRIGKWLRLTRFDELPQLWNILLGEMSFVGPRPERPCFVQEYLETIPGYDFRSNVKPGLTGLAQIYGNYTTKASDKLIYDLFYISSYSLLLDIQILLQTIRVVLTPEAARGFSEQKAQIMATQSSKKQYVNKEE